MADDTMISPGAPCASCDALADHLRAVEERWVGGEVGPCPEPAKGCPDCVTILGMIDAAAALDDTPPYV